MTIKVVDLPNKKQKPPPISDEEIELRMFCLDASLSVQRGMVSDNGFIAVESADAVVADAQRFLAFIKGELFDG